MQIFKKKSFGAITILLISLIGCKSENSDSGNEKLTTKIKTTDTEVDEMRTLILRGSHIVKTNCSGCHTYEDKASELGEPKSLYEIYKDSVSCMEKNFLILWKDSTHIKATIIEGPTDALACYLYIKQLYDPKVD